MHVRPQDLQALQRQRLQPPRHRFATEDETLRHRFTTKLFQRKA